MAALSASERAAVSGDFQRDASAVRETMSGLNKNDIRATVNAIDDLFEANSAAWNAAIPLPARTALTAQQKLNIFLRVLQRRVKGS